ncbi:MAG: hypothetical protein GY765_10830 [bacterium]|nr:hypothetical protein [bacterium]
MSKPHFKITVGSAALDSQKDPDTQLSGIEVQMGTAPFVDFAGIIVGNTTEPAGGLLGQAMAAVGGLPGMGGAAEGITAEINGNTVTTGDDFSIELGYEDSLTQVFSGILSRIEPRIDAVRFEGANGGGEMTKTRLLQTYDNKPAGKILSDLASQARVSTGTIENGIDFPFYAIDERKHLFQHAIELAQKSGFFIMFTPDNKLEMKAFTKSKGDFTFTYGEDILKLQILHSMPVAGKVTVIGESPAGSQGGEAWHWLIKDPGPVKAEAGDGNQLLIQVPSVRMKKGCETYAEAKQDLLTRSAIHGRLITPGTPELTPGDAIEIKDVPTDSLNGLFQVRRVKHRFDVRRGFTTTVDFITAAGGGTSGGLGGLL